MPSNTPPLEDIIQLAARHLPDGYRIEMVVEHKSGWMELIDKDEIVIMQNEPDQAWADCMVYMINEARDLEKLEPIDPNNLPKGQ